MALVLNVKDVTSVTFQPSETLGIYVMAREIILKLSWRFSCGNSLLYNQLHKA